jgi:hypothetical protein
MGSQKRQGSDSVWPLRNAQGLTFAEAKQQKAIQLGRGYGMGEIKVSQRTGSYPDGNG